MTVGTASPRSVRAVLFDLDGTLCRYRRSPGEVLAAAFEREGVDPLFTVEAYRESFDRFAERADGIDDLRERCFAALCAERGHDPDLGRAVARTFADERDQHDVVPTPGARAVVDDLAARHRLGVVTNGPRDAQLAKLDGVGLRERFDVVVCAGAETPAKPAPEPFERACAALDADPASTLFVGDSLETDVAGANATGLCSVLVEWDRAESNERATGVRPDHRVASLEALRPLLDRTVR